MKWARDAQLSHGDTGTLSFSVASDATIRNPYETGNITKGTSVYAHMILANEEKADEIAEHLVERRLVYTGVSSVETRKQMDTYDTRKADDD